MKSAKKCHSDLMKDILPLARELTRLKKQAAALGLFTNNRELIECTGCDLAEDVAFDGRLITFHRNGDDLGDCGLHFEMIDETFRCPICGALLKVDFL